MAPRKISGISIKMALRKSRGYRSRGAYKLRKMRRRIKRGGMQMYKRIFNIHKFKRLGESATIDNYTQGQVQLSTLANGWFVGAATPDINATYQFPGAMQFQLDQTLQSADFTTLFDRYRITGVKVTIISLGSVNNPGVAVSGATNYPSIVYAVDNDDANAPTSWDDVAVKQNAKIRRLDKPISIYIHKPRIANQVYDGFVPAYTVNTGFVNCSYPSVPHYGLKFFVRECPLPAPVGATAGSNNALIRIATKFYLSMKDPQ